MYNHNKAQQSKNRVHISWDILFCNSWIHNLTIKWAKLIWGSVHPCGNKYLWRIAPRLWSIWPANAIIRFQRGTSRAVELLYKSHNTPVPYPTMQHFVTEMCSCVHRSVTKWRFVGYLSDALWDLWGRYCSIFWVNRRRSSTGYNR